METIETIKKRRSIRGFLDKDIPDKEIKEIVETGLKAPSSKNSNPWFFVIVRGKQKDQIADWVAESVKKGDVPNQPTSAKTGEVAKGSFDSTEDSIKTIKEAPVLVLIFNRAPLSGGKKFVMNCNDNGRSLYSYACEMIGIGAAMQNILLAAFAKGYGAVYMADSYPARMSIEKALNTEAELLGSISIGYPSYSIEPRNIHPNLVSTWEDAQKNGIPDENFTAKKFWNPDKGFI